MRLGVLALQLCFVLCAYPFDTAVGAPKCQAHHCAYCQMDWVEYSPVQAYLQHRHVVAGDAFFEGDLSGRCCGDSGCHGSGNEQIGYGVCWKASGGHSSCGIFGICQHDRCHCRRLSYEIIPNECFTCDDNFEVDENFQCQPCPVGTRGLDGKTCQKIDACAEGIHSCHEHAKCDSTGPGTYTCECSAGYEGSGTSCRPIDNCAKGPSVNRCDEHATCAVSGPGTNTCVCKPGYQGDGTYCRDIDECSSVSACAAGSYCINTLGSFSCAACHSNCHSSCMGPGADQCDRCKHFKDGATCVSQCPMDKFANSNTECEACHPECKGGCAGAQNTDCVACAHLRSIGGACIASCDNGSFSDSGVCRPCRQGCSAGTYEKESCSAQADLECVPCEAGFQCPQGRKAVCPPGTYQPVAGQSLCIPCAPGFFCTGGTLAADGSAQAASMQVCAQGTVSPAAGSHLCLACPAPLISDHNRTRCVEQCSIMNLCIAGFDCISTAAGYSCINTTESAVAMATPASSELAADSSSSPVVPVVVVVVLLLVLALAFAAWYFCWHKRKQPSTAGAVQIPMERTGDWEQVLQHDTDADTLELGPPREAYAQYGNNAHDEQVEGGSPDGGAGGQYFVRERGSPVAPPVMPLRLPPRPKSGLADNHRPASAGRPEGAPQSTYAVEEVCPEGVTIHFEGKEG